MVFRYEFPVSNNEAEHKTLIIGLYMAKDLDIKRVIFLCDYQLVVNQITTTFEDSEPQMVMYSKTWILALILSRSNMFHEKQM